MLKRLILAMALALSAPGAMAAEPVDELRIVTADAETELSDFLWQARPLVVFADSEFDPNFVEQLDLITRDAERLAERDVVVILDTDPEAMTPVRTELRPRGFDFVLIGKDGQKYLRKSVPWDVRELSRSIDKMPIRVQETEKARTTR